MIARSLNLGTRARLLTKKDIEQAFHEASVGKPVILSFNHHDFRDMRPDVRYVRKLIKEVSTKFPGINYKYSEAGDAFRKVLNLPKEKTLKFDIHWENERLCIKSNKKNYLVHNLT